jgi:hypothetical protein
VAGGAAGGSKLRGGGLDVRPILFPVVPGGSAWLRFFLSSKPTPEDIHQAVAVLAAARDGGASCETGHRLSLPEVRPVGSRAKA